MPIHGRGTDADPLVCYTSEVLDVEAMTQIEDGQPSIVVHLARVGTGETCSVAFSLAEWRRLVRLGGRAMAEHGGEDE